MTVMKKIDGLPRGGLVLSLFDYTGNMVRPWAEAGYETMCIDIQRDGTPLGDETSAILDFLERMAALRGSS